MKNVINLQYCCGKIYVYKHLRNSTEGMGAFTRPFKTILRI